MIRGTVRALLSGDLSVTAGEAVGRPSPAILLPLATLQHTFPEAPNTIVVKNTGRGGMDDIGPGGSRSRAVVQLLRHLFPAAPSSLTSPHALSQTQFDAFRIHPLKPDVVVEQQTLQLDKVVFLSAAGQQFSWLPEVFTLVLVGAGMLLLALLLILLAAERRAEVGNSRALGMQRRRGIVLLLLFEGCGYGVVATTLGVVLGFGATALELAALAKLPLLAPGQAVGNAVSLPVILPLHLWLSPQSVLSAWCLGVLTTLLVVLLTALRASRTPIVTAMRDLDDAPAGHSDLRRMWRALRHAPLDVAGAPITETRAGRRSRRYGAAIALLWGLWARGPLCLAAGVGPACAGQRRGAALAGRTRTCRGDRRRGPRRRLAPLPGRLRRPMGEPARRPQPDRGLGWLALGLHVDGTFLALFQPVVQPYEGPPPALDLLLSLLLPVAGAVLLMMAGIDLPVAAAGAALRRVPGLAPIGRIGLIGPLTSVSGQG